MGIENKSHNITFSYRSTNITVKHQKDFIHVLGFYEFLIIVYNYIIDGIIPRIFFVFKVDKGDDDTSVQVKQALEVCILLSPIHDSLIMIKDICLDVDRSSSRSAMFRDAIVLSTLENFCGKSIYGYLTAQYSQAK